jgi:MFS family permease
MTGPNTEKIAPYQWTLFTLCFLSVAFGGMVSTLMSIYLPDVMKELQQNDAEQLAHITAYINAAFIFGWAIGGFVWGMIADKTGRKKAFILCVGCYGLFTILTGRVSDWQMIACCRLASGFGMGGLLVVSTTLMIEEWNEKSKAVFMGILSISMPVGIFSAGWLTHSISNWRTAFLIGAAPVLLSILSAWAKKAFAGRKKSV